MYFTTSFLVCSSIALIIHLYSRKKLPAKTALLREKGFENDHDPYPPPWTFNWWDYVRYYILKMVIIPINVGLGAVHLPPYLLGCLILGRPPITPTISRIIFIFKHVYWGKHANSNTAGERLRWALATIQSLALAPMWGTHWFIDIILFEKYYAREQIKEPLFIISLPRTGSTLLGHYMEMDRDTLITPTTREVLFPMIFVWKLIEIFSWINLPIKEIWVRQFPAEMRKRHVTRPEESDTIEYLFGFHSMIPWNSMIGGPSSCDRVSFQPAEDNEVYDVWLDDYMRFIDTIAKKIMYWRGGKGQKFFVKGHLITLGARLKEKYPGSYFMTSVRDPMDMLDSVIGFGRPWPQRYQALMAHTPIYYGAFVKDDIKRATDAEMDFFLDGKNHIVDERKICISFQKYIDNLPGTLRSIYQMMGLEISPDFKLQITKFVQYQREIGARRKASYLPGPTWKSDLGYKREELEKEFDRYYRLMVKGENVVG